MLLQVFVGEVLSVNQDKADCLEVFFYFFSHTLAITTLDVLFFLSSDNPVIENVLLFHAM